MSWKFTWMLPNIPAEQAIAPESKEKNNKFYNKRKIKINNKRRYKNV